MDVVTLSQVANPILQTVFIAIIGLGYYYTVKATRATVQEMRAEHAAGGGRPLITVSEDYANLPNISLIVQNIGQGPAKDISFEFSEPVQSSDGLILSELPFFSEGMTSLAPGAKIGCYWDTLDNLLPLSKEGKIASDIAVTVRYKDLNLNTKRSPERRHREVGRTLLPRSPVNRSCQDVSRLHTSDHFPSPPTHLGLRDFLPGYSSW